MRKRYEKETGKDYFAPETLVDGGMSGTGTYSNDYVKWLEEKTSTTEEFVDWLVAVNVAHYKTDKTRDYDPGCKSHFYLKGSAERFSTKQMIEIYNNTADDETNQNWQYALVDHTVFCKRN